MKNDYCEQNKTNPGQKLKLLLHACCAPCSTAVYERLCERFSLTVFWYNPNIFPAAEHDKRLKEIEKLASILGFMLIIDEQSALDHDKWNGGAKKHANVPEGGIRCHFCYRFRMERAYQYAIDHNFDYFSTTLTVSPRKNAPKIMEIGKELERKSKETRFVDEVFRKNNGFLRSVELSKQYGLYRQDYCGCEYSKNHESS